MRKIFSLVLTLLIVTGCGKGNELGSNSACYNFYLNDEYGKAYKSDWLTKDNAFMEKISERDHEIIGVNHGYFGRTRIKASQSESLPETMADFIYGTSFDEDYPKLRGKRIILHADFNLQDKDNKKRTTVGYDILALPAFDYDSFYSFDISFPSQDVRYVIFNTFGHFQIDFSGFKDKISTTKCSSVNFFSYALIDRSDTGGENKKYLTATNDNDSIYFLFEEDGSLVLSEEPF